MSVRFKIRDDKGNYYETERIFRELEHAKERAKVLANKLKGDMLIEKTELVKCVCPDRTW